MLAIETTRLAIRNFRAEDAPRLRQLILQYQASPYGRYDQPWPTSEREIQEITNWFATGDDFAAVYLIDTGQFIGMITMSQTENPELAEFGFGYIFDSDYHRKGYAFESCQALIDHAFSARNAQRISTGTAAVNEPSCRLLQRLGFKKVSEATTHFQIAADGTPDKFLGYTFELTRADWAERQSRLNV